MLANRAIIIAIGPVSSQFTEHLVRAVLNGPPHHGIVAVGIYDDDVAGSRVRRAIRKLIAGKDIEDISVEPAGEQHAQNPGLDALVELKHKVMRLSPSRVFLVTDAAYIGNETYAGVIRELRIASVQLEMTALCFTYDRTQMERTGHDRLLEFTRPDSILETAPILEGVFVARVDSPLAATVGGTSYQNQLLAKSLAGIWSGPLYRNFTSSLREQLNLLNPEGGGFVGLGIASKGLTMRRGEGLFASISYWLHRKSLESITIEWARENLTRLTRSVLTNRLEQSHIDLSTSQPVDVEAATTTVEPFNAAERIKQQPVLVNLIAPFRSDDSRFEPVRAGVQQDLAAAGYQVIHTSMITGKGVDLSQNQNFSAWKGAFYCQVCVLFSTSLDRISSNSGGSAVTLASSGDAQSEQSRTRLYEDRRT